MYTGQGRERHQVRCVRQHPPRPRRPAAHLQAPGRGKRVERVEDVLNLGDEVTVRVDDIDNSGKLSLSLAGDEPTAAEGAGGEGDGEARARPVQRASRASRAPRATATSKWRRSTPSGTPSHARSSATSVPRPRAAAATAVVTVAASVAVAAAGAVVAAAAGAEPDRLNGRAEVRQGMPVVRR